MSQPSSFRGGGAPGTPNAQKPPSFVEMQRLTSASDLGPRSDTNSEVRTRDGRHSPYTAKVIEGPSSREMDPPPVSYPMQHLATSSSASSIPQSPPKGGMPQSPNNTSNREMPPTYEEAYTRAAVHISLSGRCAFVPIPLEVPPYREIPIEDPSTLPPPLFLGQLRFETTASEIRYLLHQLSGVEPLRIEPRGNACWVAQLKCELDNDAVRLLHKKVLFDIPGVWVAETTAEVDALRQYTGLQLAQMSRKAHLPRDCLVVEEARAPNAPSPNIGPSTPSSLPPPPPPPGSGPAPLSLLQSLNNLPAYHQPPGFVERSYRGQRQPPGGSQPGSAVSSQPTSFSGRPPSVRVGGTIVAPPSSGGVRLGGGGSQPASPSYPNNGSR